MKNLIEILKKETESLRIQYIEMTEKWAVAQVDTNIKRKNAYVTSYSTFTKQQKIVEQKFYWNSPAWYFDRKVFVERQIKAANEHYESSILKLADRISVKGLDQDKLTILTSHVGVNINTTLTDGIKIVRAFTIIASGGVQRPHYRYLVK